MPSSTRLILSILAVVGLAVAFWALLLSPKREKADHLGNEAQQLTAQLESARREVTAAQTAKRSFPADYRQLVVLGQAAPADDETASLLAELQLLATSSGVSFASLQLEGSGEESSVAVPPPAPTTPEPSNGSGEAVQAAATVPATELAASLLPLGASIGPAGLYVMPYSLEFQGSFFQITDFIRRVDELVSHGDEGIDVDGRLITINGFTLAPDSDTDSTNLVATLNATTYLAPPSQGVTASATPAGATETTVPASAPVEGSPAPSSETVSAR